MKTQEKHWAVETVDKYITGVLDGSIVACKYVKLACQRYLNDIEHGQERGLYFDEDSAIHILDFFSHLKHTKGKWAGQYFELSDWQVFILWVLFGWKNADGTRRFRFAYNEVARKNGKSTLAAGIGLYMFGFDGEQGAECYTVATKMEQAKIVHKEAENMVRKSAGLRKRFGIHVNNIHDIETASKFEPLGADSKTMDGLNPHCTLVDELHAHPDGSLVDVMRSAMGARTQPMLLAITTAGFNSNNYCHQQRDYAVKILQGIIEDDTFFAIIFTLDGWDTNEPDKDDWKDPAVWAKANPNLNISVGIKDMQDMAKEAAESPGKLNNFLVKKLNIWTTQQVKYINLDKWNECKEVISEDDLIGKRCMVGLDLSTNTDIAGYVLVFQFDDKYAVLPRLFIPKDNAIARQRKDKVPYPTWIEQGYLIATSGNVIDYKAIRQKLFEDSNKFNIDQIAFDRWNFEALRQQLIEEGLPESKMIAFGQGYASMSSPTKKLEAIILAIQIIHNNNPVLRWMAENLTVSTDPAGNVKPDKEKSNEKIDGMVMLIMALGLWITKPQKTASVYETRGVLIYENN